MPTRNENLMRILKYKLINPYRANVAFLYPLFVGSIEMDRWQNGRLANGKLCSKRRSAVLNVDLEKGEG